MKFQIEKSAVLSGTVRILACSALVFLCFYLSLIVLRHGSSRAMQLAATSQTSLQAADYATTLTPDDPEAHYAKAIVLGNLQRVDESAVELREAIRLRPHHFYEWLDLGVTLDRLGDGAGAMVAVNQSIRLAPSFAQPRWQLGNLLFRQGKYDEAFAQLRLAADKDVNLVPSVVAMAWTATGGDVAAAEQLVRPNSPRAHLEFAKFLAGQGNGADAARQIKDAGEIEDQDYRTLFNQTVSALIDSHHFAEAYQVWSARGNDSNQTKMPGVVNADFSAPIVRDEPGFGWQVPTVPNVSASIDPSGPPSHGRSVHLHFTGVSDVTDAVLKQLVLVETRSRYSLTFAVRSESLVTGGLPAVYVLNAAHPEEILGQSKPFPTGTVGWTNDEIQFVAGEDVSAVAVVIRRESCGGGPCPVFGDAWLGAFSLRKL